MSESEKFLDRWSRRKRKAADEPTPVAAKDPTAAPLPPVAGANAPATKVAFDPASLPPIESIGANSDIRAFLQAGVPPDLSRAALRRAWSTDPAIRDFIGLVENGWDFNDPNGIPGFGPINAGDVANLLARVIGAPPPETDAPRQVVAAQDDSGQNPPPAVDSKQPPQLPQDQPAPNQDLAAPEKDSMQRSEDDVASQYDSNDRENFPPSRQRGHGGALPK
jgi:Protein of unknown function (DUF3306)